MEKFSHTAEGNIKSKKIKKTDVPDSRNDQNNPEEPPKTDTYGDAPKEWQEFYATFSRVRKELLNILLESGKFDEYYEKIQEKEHSSASSVADPHKYLVFHLCIASGIGPISAPKTDYEGEHALLPFYQKLLAEMKK